MGSQCGEEDLVHRFLHDVKEGKYVDIGAGDAVQHSNTLHLYEKGWRGLVVEPFNIYHASWKEKRPRDILLPIAVAGHNGSIQMCNTTTVGSWLGNEYVKEWEAGLREKDGRPHDIYTAPCKTIKRIIEENPDFRNADFVSIDVESNEDNVLYGWDFDYFRPKLICIECILRGVDQRGRWENKLYPYYNQVDRTMNNAFYLRKP